MNYVDSFYNFAHNNGSVNMNELFSLGAQGYMPKYTCEEFKNLFTEYLNEADEYMDSESLDEAHSYYEMSMLAEAKSSWDRTDGEIHYIDAETHVILVKNSDAFIIEKKTFDLVQNINEFKIPSINDISSGFNSFKNKVVSYTKEKIGQAKKMVVKAWDKISDGAKKAYAWLKSAISATGKFLGDNLETISLVLGILSAVFGIAGGITTAVGVGPILTIIGGSLMALNGGLHIYEGFQKLKHGTDVLKNVPVDPTTKLIAGFVKAGPEFLLGGLFLPMGFYDISHGLTDALVNPAAGSIGMAVKGTAKKAAKSWVGNIGHTLENVLGGFLKKYVANPKVGAAIGGGIAGLSSVILAKYFTDVCGWLYDFMLKSTDAILKGVNWLLDIPKKLTDGISKFSKSANGVLSKIISQGLNALVKPMTSYLAKISEKYFKPLVKKSQEFIKKQILAKKILDNEMNSAHGGHGKGADAKKHTTIPKTKGKPIVNINKVVVKNEDLEQLKKLPKINNDLKKADIEFSTKEKIKESQIWEMNHLRSFDDLEFI